VKDLLNLKAMAMKLGVSLEMVRRMAASGEIPHLRVGKRVLFSEDAVEAWVLSRMESSCHHRRKVLAWKLLKTDEVSLPFRVSPEEMKSWAEQGLVLCVLMDSLFVPSKSATVLEAPEDLEGGLQEPTTDSTLSSSHPES
jgi:excisionase family DNA binding protein